MENIKELNTALNQLYKKQDDLYHEYAAHFGLSDTAFWILYYLCETEDTYTQNMLADMWHLPKQSINSSVSTLVKAGYIKLEQMAVARNNKALRLTPQGMQFCQRVIFPFYELEERILMRMTEEERNAFLAFSTKQCDLLKEEIEEVIKSDNRNLAKGGGTLT